MPATVACLRRTSATYPARTTAPVAGSVFPGSCEIIEVHVAKVTQLFNSIDPSPFREKDLDQNAEEFIVGWARELSTESQLALLVHIDEPDADSEEYADLGVALREFFGHRAEATRQRLSQLFRIGRKSLLIGITFLAGAIGVSDIAALLTHRPLGEILHESFLIGGWVAMWRPLEIFLYDWWPIRADARLFQRLASMPVRIADSTDAAGQH